MTNKALSKALSLLSHPLSLLAIALLFTNDHILRVFWPSWMTGKLGDFAWLFIMPFAVAAVFAILVPTSHRNHTGIVGVLAFGLVAVVFILGNSLPAAHYLLAGWLARLSPIPVRITRDPTDLIALAAWGFSWWLWRGKSNPAPDVSRKAALLVPLTALLTIANAAQPDHGITCLIAEEHQVVARASFYHQNYASDDGGLTWQPVDRDLYDHCVDHLYQDSTMDGMVADPDDDTRLYRMNNQKQFVTSGDKGKTWEKVPAINFATEAELAFNQLYRNQSAIYEPGPFQVVKDPVTGNLIFAMGHEGILVRKPSGEWSVVPVGRYGPEKLTLTMVPVLLFGEIVLALELGLLLFCSLSLVKDQSWIRVILIVILWIAWMFVTTGLRPALNGGYGLPLQHMLLIAIGIIALGTTIISARRTFQRFSKGSTYRLAKIALLGSLVFFCPYLFWAWNIIPDYSASMAIGLLFSVVIFIVGLQQAQKSSDETT